MTIIKAIQRLSWRFGTGNSFKPNEGDIEALNAIIQYVNDAKESKLETNRGFAKLYMWAYSTILQRHKATPLDEIPQKELHKLLDRPLSYFVKRFTENLNEHERDCVLKEAGVELIHPALDTRPEEEKLADAKKLEEYLKDENNRTRFEGKAWIEEDVEANLMAQISDALIKFKL